MAAAKETDITISYIFNFPENSEQRQFDIAIDRKTFRLKQLVLKPEDSSGKLPKWTKLDCHKCPNCPLDEKVHEYCPAATSLIDVIEFFARRKSTEMVNVVVKTEPRDYSKYVELHTAVSSLMGIYMAAGGCPVLGQLRPMVQFHLPFAGSHETFFRNISLYLCKQLLTAKNGGAPDWNIERVKEGYEAIAEVNRAFIARLRTLKIDDSALNALVRLNCFTDFLTFFDEEFLLQTLSGMIPSDLIKIKKRKFLN